MDWNSTPFVIMTKASPVTCMRRPPNYMPEHSLASTAKAVQIQHKKPNKRGLKSPPNQPARKRHRLVSTPPHRNLRSRLRPSGQPLPDLPALPPVLPAAGQYSPNLPALLFDLPVNLLATNPMTMTPIQSISLQHQKRKSPASFQLLPPTKSSCLNTTPPTPSVRLYNMNSPPP